MAKVKLGDGRFEPARPGYYKSGRVLVNIVSVEDGHVLIEWPEGSGNRMRRECVSEEYVWACLHVDPNQRLPGR